MRAKPLALLTLAAGAAWAAPPPGGFELSVSNGEYALEACEAPVNEILADLSRQIGVRARTDPSDARTVTVRVRTRDLETLINAIAADAVLTWIRDPRTDRYILEEIRTCRPEDPEVKQRQLAELERARAAAEWKPPPVAPRHPLRYSGIGAGLAMAPDGEGILVYPLSPDSPAARAGLQAGSYVTAVDGRPIREFAGLNEITEAIRGPPGTQVELRVRRGYGEEVTVVVGREMFEYRPPKE